MSLTVEKCLQAWINSLRQMKAKADIVFFGDSLTYYGDFASVFPDKLVCNLGLRGDTIQGMIDRMEQVRLLEPKRIFLMAGINDVGLVSVDDFASLYSRLITSLTQNVPEAELIVQSILPVNTQNFCIGCDNKQICICNSRIKKIAEVRGLDYLDVYSLYEESGQLPIELTRDGIHLNQKAYQILYELISNTSST